MTDRRQIKDITDLTVKFLQGTLTPEEEAWLNGWLDASPENRRRFEERTSDRQLLVSQALWKRAEEEMEGERKKLETVLTGNTPANVLRLGSRRKYWVAVAAVLSLLVVGMYLLTSRQKPTDKQPLAVAQVKIVPGGNHALLTLANGKQVVLDSLQNGVIASQGGGQVAKTASGQLAYTGSATTNGQLLYNTVATPAGGQFMITLGDGTRVWLNNASSIHYPVLFTGKTRTVELTGEAYFEVAHNASQPFVVEQNGLTVQVLGTHFEIMGYTDEPGQKVTLLKGSVKVTKGLEELILQPGEQSAFAAKGKLKMLKGVDTVEVVSWKNGFFHFKAEDIPSVMRQLARWYNVTIEYNGAIPSKAIEGRIDRNLPLDAVLKGLETTDLHFAIKGTTVIVSKN